LPNHTLIQQRLEYFLKVIGGIDYVHVLYLVPTQDILDEYKKKKVDWTIYEQKFRQLISSRRIETKVSPEIINNACLLCREAHTVCVAYSVG
jgi:hypothetical protein